MAYILGELRNSRTTHDPSGLMEDVTTLDLRLGHDHLSIDESLRSEVPAPYEYFWWESPSSSERPTADTSVSRYWHSCHRLLLNYDCSGRYDERQT